MLQNDHPPHCARSPRPRYENGVGCASRNQASAARPRCWETRALQGKRTAPTSGPSQQCVQAIRPPGSKSVGLGVTVPQNPHRKAPKPLRRPLCTAARGRAAVRSPIRKGAQGSPRGGRAAGQRCPAVWGRARSARPKGGILVPCHSTSVGKGLRTAEPRKNNFRHTFQPKSRGVAILGP